MLSTVGGMNNDWGMSSCMRIFKNVWLVCKDITLIHMHIQQRLVLRAASLFLLSVKKYLHGDITLETDIIVFLSRPSGLSGMLQGWFQYIYYKTHEAKKGSHTLTFCLLLLIASPPPMPAFFLYTHPLTWKREYYNSTSWRYLVVFIDERERNKIQKFKTLLQG